MEFFGISGGEFLIILIVATIVLGPEAITVRFADSEKLWTKGFSRGFEKPARISKRRAFRTWIYPHST